MSKRSQGSLSKSKPKRAKVSVNQPLIHHFFSPSKHPVNSALGGGPSSVGVPTARQSPDPALDIIDVDLLNADETDGLGSLPRDKQQTGLVVSSKRPSFMISTPNEPVVYADLSLDAVTHECNLKPWASVSVPYSFLAHTLSTLAQTRSRIIINNTLTNCLRMIILHDPDSLIAAIYLLSNTLAPAYSHIELGLGPAIISRSIQRISGLPSAALKRMYNATGDVGDVAFAAKTNLRTLLPHPPLLVKFVYASLLKIAHCKGQGTAKEKQRIVETLLLAATGEEIRFLTRTLSQNLRVGAVRTTILTALSRAFVLTPITHFIPDHKKSTYLASSAFNQLKPASSRTGKAVESARDALAAEFTRAESLIKRVYVQHPNYEDIITALLQVGLDGLDKKVYLTVGIPLHPTLGSPVRSLDAAYEISQGRPFVAEYKYDGQRAQIHGSIQSGQASITIFSRHLEDMTSKYPDVIQLVKNIFQDHPETTSFILDTEIVAIDTSGELKSFQELSNRARKDVQLQNVKVLVSVFAFDLMYLNGEVLLEHAFRERRELLHFHFPPVIHSDQQIAQFNHVESCASTDGRESVENFLAKAIEDRCEGLMIKLLDNEPITDNSNNITKSRRKQLPATYEPDKRTSAWLKLKKDYVTGLGDSLDLIPIGAWHGNGRKAQWWSPILLGLWQSESGRIVAVCKCMSGFTDVFYKELAERYQLSEISDTCSQQSLWSCDMGGLIPEVYFKPQEVWEIRGADITLSPVSIAAKGLISGSRGLSLRFPRFIRARDDKSLEQASTPHSLAKMWRDQEGKGRGLAEDGELDIESDASVVDYAEDLFES